MEEKKLEIPKKISPDEMRKDTQKKDDKHKSNTRLNERLNKVEDRLDLVCNFSAGSFYTASGVAYTSGPWWLGPLLTIGGLAASYLESLMRQLRNKYGSISGVRKSEGSIRKGLTTIKTR
jgi:hypothetical protein